MPLPRFLRWAVTALYPAGAQAWSGTSTTTEPPYDFYTPGVPSGSQEDNYILKSIGEAAALVASVPLGHMTVTASASSITGGSSALDVFAYDEGGGIWHAAGHTGAVTLVSSPDNGITWTGTVTPAGQVNAIGIIVPNGTANPTSYISNPGILILGGTNNVFWYDGTGGGSLTDSGSTQGVTFNSGAVAFGLPVASVVFGFAYDGTNHRTRAFYATGPASYTALTLPASWQTGPQTNIHYFTHCVGPTNDALIAWGGNTPGSDTSYILHMSAASFPTTPTFSALVLPAGISGNSVVGVAYNATTEQFGAMVYDGTACALWTSSDLTAWTKHTTLFPGACGGLITIGPYWVTTAKRNSVPGTNNYTPIYSFDGDTWMRSAGTAIPSLPKLAQGKGCLAVWDVNDAMVSAARIG